jgi:transposase InsO family protein
VPGDRLRAERPGHVWAFDFQWDVTEDGRAIKLLYVVDEFTREALAMQPERSIDADKVVNVLDRIIAEQARGPELVRCDNGPEMTSHALRDWCASPGPGRRSSNLAHPGRTRSSRASTAGFATSCWPWRPSPA